MQWAIKSNVGKRMLMLFSGDLLISVFGLFLSAYIFYGNTVSNIIDSGIIGFKIPVFAITVLFFSFFIEVYTGRKSFRRRAMVFRSLSAGMLSFITLYIIYLFLPSHRIERDILILALFIFIVLQSCWHILYYIVLNHPLFSKNVLIVGTGSNAETAGHLIDDTNSNYLLKGFIKTLYDPLVVPESKIIGDVDSIIDIVNHEHIDLIVMALTERRANLPTDKLLRCKLVGVNILEFPSFYELLTGKLMIEGITPSWFLFSDGFRITLQIKFCKRISDLFFSFIGLLLSLPLFPVVACIIKLTSPGPVFYNQKRSGEIGKEFYIHKFRTMVNDAESTTGAVWSAKNDNRITPIGSFLRKTRIDEIPQLFNVLKGDMSFIGPRPERPELVKQITEMTQYYPERHFVKPGLTGWAQIKYPYGASFGDSIEKLRYDLYYIKNISLTLDLMIVIETIKVIIFRRGGR